METLNVFYENILVGHLTENAKLQLCFSYSNNWLKSETAIALSPELPLSEQKFSCNPVESFFENLLPEGDVLDFISQAVHLSPSNIFGLLERFGGDTSGAFSVLPEDIAPSDQPHYLPVTIKQINTWFKQSKGIPLTIKGEQARMSLSGAQDKMTVFIDSAGIFLIPLGSAPSSHIIKPSVNHQLNIPHTAINEVLMMMLAKNVGLNVAEVHYNFELCAAVITRYDREIKQGKLKRIHQNDFCQIQGIPSNKKYEAEGGASLVDCFDAVLKYSWQPAKDKKRLIEWVIFNLLIGNMDSHAKNLSIIHNNHKKQLTPFYDMLCTSVYPSLSQKFAFKIGGENRPDWIMRRHWEQFAIDIDTKPSFVINTITDMMQRIEQSLPCVIKEINKNISLSDEKEMIEKISKKIKTILLKMKPRITG